MEERLSNEETIFCEASSSWSSASLKVEKKVQVVFVGGLLL